MDRHRIWICRIRQLKKKLSHPVYFVRRSHQLFRDWAIPKSPITFYKEKDGGTRFPYPVHVTLACLASAARLRRRA